MLLFLFLISIDDAKNSDCIMEENPQIQITKEILL